MALQTFSVENRACFVQWKQMTLRIFAVEFRAYKCNGNKWACRRFQLNTELCAMGIKGLDDFSFVQWNGFADVGS